MATLKHEVWREPDGMEMCCLAGPMGDDARRALAPGATLLWTFDAGTHFEAMTKYNDFLGRAPYTTDQEADRQPYPDDWRATQR